MRIPLSPAVAGTEVKKSRFIALSFPCSCAAELKDLLSRTRADYSDATHICHAAVMGNSGTLFSMSDDREPKNTAGRPMLEVLKGSGITNIAVLVVRYFGGTLLGTGGLVKAYGDAVKEVLAVTPTEEYIKRISASVTIPYSAYTKTKALFEELSATVAKEDLSESALFEILLPEEHANLLNKQIADLTNGIGTVSVLDKN